MPIRLALIALAAILQSSAALALDAPFLLIRRSLEALPVDLAEISERRIVVRDETGGFIDFALEDCLALVNTAVVLPPAPPTANTRTSVLFLADGQRLLGQPVANSGNPNILIWRNAWLDRVEVPLDHIRALSLAPNAVPPPADADDVVMLTNGDRIAGIVTGISDTISIEMTTESGPSTITLPLARVASVTLVTPDLPRTLRRVWLTDGSVIDVRDVAVGDDGYVRFIQPRYAASRTSAQTQLSELAAILFDPTLVTPLASLRPAELDGPPTRIDIPSPAALTAVAPLDAPPLLFRGPLVVRYHLPPGVQRFAAEAVLPESARTWGDLDFIVRDDDVEILRVRLNAANPVARVNVPIKGTELTIEIAEGFNGPVQDIVRLDRALLAVRRSP